MNHETETFDVVVAGSGVAGCAAALVAAGNGLKTLLIEKAPQLGGTTSQSGGHMWLPLNHHAPETVNDGKRDTIEDAMAYLRFVGAGKQDEARIRAYVENGPDALREVERLGMKFQSVPLYPDLYYSHAPGSTSGGRNVEIKPFPMDSLGEWKDKVCESAYTDYRPRGGSQFDLFAWKARNDPNRWDRNVLRERNQNGDRCSFGYGLIGAFLEALLDHGCEIRLNTALRDLIFEDSRVVGLAVQGQTTGMIRARRGVILATGGYESNPELVRQLEELGDDYRSAASPYHTGEGLLAAAKLGAGVRRIVPNAAIMMAYPSPKTNAEVMLMGNTELCRPHTIVVDGQAKRFADEAFFQDVAAGVLTFDAKSHTFPHRNCHWILDDHYMQKFGFLGERDVEEFPAWVHKADDIRTLAEKVGLDPDVLTKTVARFNEHASEGLDPDFERGTNTWSQRAAGGDVGSGSSNVAPLTKAPFYAVPLFISGVCSAGILANEKAEVLRWDTTPIKGLYAAGFVAAHTQYGVGYQAGFDLGSGLTFGYIAARSAMANRHS